MGLLNKCKGALTKCMNCAKPKVLKFASCSGGEQVKEATEVMLTEMEDGMNDGSILQEETGIKIIKDALLKLPEGPALLTQFEMLVEKAKEAGEKPVEKAKEAGEQPVEKAKEAGEQP